MSDTIEWTIQRFMEETTEELVEQLLRNIQCKKCVGCDLKFPLYWERRGTGFWYHEDGAGGIICERHPDNEEYWRKCGQEDQDGSAGTSYRDSG